MTITRAQVVTPEQHTQPPRWKLVFFKCSLTSLTTFLYVINSKGTSKSLQPLQQSMKMPFQLIKRNRWKESIFNSHYNMNTLHTANSPDFKGTQHAFRFSNPWSTGSEESTPGEMRRHKEPKWMAEGSV